MQDPNFTKFDNPLPHVPDLLIDMMTRMHTMCCDHTAYLVAAGYPTPAERLTAMHELLTELALRTEQVFADLAQPF